MTTIANLQPLKPGDKQKHFANQVIRQLNSSWDEAWSELWYEVPQELEALVDLRRLSDLLDFFPAPEGSRAEALLQQLQWLEQIATFMNASDAS